MKDGFRRKLRWLRMPLLAAGWPVSSALALDTIVVFNEIHYHPADDEEPGVEFVELYNQNTIDVDLSGWRLSGGIDFDFPDRTVMRGGEYVVVAADPAALQAAGAGRVLGPFSGRLDNAGETIRLRNHNERIMDEVEYNDRGGWPVGADGSGASLSKLDPQTSGARGAQWAASVAIGGTPGAPNFGAPPPAVAINEVAGSAAPPGEFFVELHNGTGGNVDLGGYVLASEAGDAHPLAAETIVPAAGVLAIWEATLGFRPADGDNLYLYLPEKAGLLDAVRADDLGRARHPDGRGDMHVTEGEIAATPGEPNPAPPPSLIVINEIMYHHRPTYADAGPPAVAFAENEEEWIELYNTSEQPVMLDGWAFEGAVGFAMPAGTTIPGGGYLVVAKDATAFAAKFPGVSVVGEFSGSLSNRGEELFLRDAVGNAADRVFYRDGAPWPKEADGGGSSLELINPLADNAAPGAWRASDNTDASEWHDYEFTLRAQTPRYTPNIYNFHELRIGLLDGGTILLDDLSVIEEPGGANRELMANGTFDGLAGWRLLGTHKDSRPTADAGERVLRVVAASRMNYLNNLIEGSLSSGGVPRPVREGVTYRVSFRAKWISGSPQLRLELYYNKLARTVILRQPERHGTPGAQNSAYLADPGPVLRDLRHEPAVPRPEQPIEVSVTASDPDGIATMTLYHKVNDDGFRATPMSLDAADDRWKGTIPAQSNGALIQFYVQGIDAGPNGPNGPRGTEPPGGARSRALIRVDSSVAHGTKHSIRLLMLPADAGALHASNDILSNYRFGATIITDEREIAYDAGVRLRGSMFSRNNQATSALNLKFPEDRLYRGVHSTITTRRGNRREIMVKHIVNQAGGIHDNYNDILYQYGHVSAQNGEVRLEMARFGPDYLRGLPGGEGNEGTVFKMEGIREFQGTQDGTPDTPKTPFPIGWISSFDLADQGTDKEIYRHNMRINSDFEIDDYSSIIRMCRTFSLDGQALENAAPAAIDVDRWARKFALMSLCGIGDVYSQGNPHNINFYVRPGDGIVEPMPWDWDFTFSRSATSPLWGDRNVSKLFARPVYARLYYGHLRDLIRTVYNTRYLTYWFDRLGTLAGESYSGNLSYVTARANYVLSQLPAQVTFRITTNGGADFAVSEPFATLRGDGWIDVREVIVNGAPEAVIPRWTDGDSWELTVPLAPGPNELTLTALDHQGLVVGTDTITVTNTGVVEPAGPGNLAIGEIMYHPAGEAAEEFIEIVNIADGVEVDLSGAAFTDGIEFVFPDGTVLPPGGRILVVQDSGAFNARYGASLPVAGEFANGTRLSNGGERLRLETRAGETIREFTFGTRNPWPREADGDGHSLVLIAPESDPDHADPFNWRASVAPGGNPATSDAVEFVGDPDADENGDGVPDLVNHALGAGGHGPELTIGPNGVELRYSRNLAADDVRRSIEISHDLENWTSGSPDFAFDSESPAANGLTTVTLRRILIYQASDPPQFVRLRVEKR